MERVYKGDTAVVEASLYGSDGVTPYNATSVSWSILKPDGTTIAGGPASVTTTDTSIAINDTSEAGSYVVQVTFTLVDTTKKSVVVNYEVLDPLAAAATTVTLTGKDLAVERAWMKLEDLFDSSDGGPYLRERSLKGFNKQKMEMLLPDALYYINNEYQPSTTYDDVSFPYSTNGPLLTQGLLVESVYHLMRSYVEQPNPVGSNITYFDRRDYLQRWQSILQVEEKKFLAWLDLFKRDELNFGDTSTLIGGYSGYYGRQPRYMRSRYPWIVRY